MSAKEVRLATARQEIASGRYARSDAVKMTLLPADRSVFARTGVVSQNATTVQSATSPDRLPHG